MSKENENVLKAEFVARYVDKREKIIGISSDIESARKANNSKAIRILKKEFGYKIQMLIPDNGKN